MKQVIETFLIALFVTAVAWLRWRFDTRRALPRVPAASPSGEDVRLLQLARRGCLGIRHIFPPRHPRRSLSFLGGSPMAPSDFEWPMAHNAEGLLEWLPFVGQIDCSKLPEREYSSLLP